MLPPAYVLHVKTGFEDREESIRRQFEALGIAFEWVLDFDIPEIDPAVLARFGNPQHRLRPDEISCCLKHRAAWERIIHSGAGAGLVLEDDVLLDRHAFGRILALALDELGRRHGASGCICLGDGCALHVPWTRTRRGTLLYPAGLMRASDSYWIDRRSAAALRARVDARGFCLPADHLIGTLLQELGIPLFWLEPTIVHQGSHSGVFKSTIQRDDEGLLNKHLEFWIKKIRRKYIYPLLGIDPRYRGAPAAGQGPDPGPSEGK